jgi:hypothetical protein
MRAAVVMRSADTRGTAGGTDRAFNVDVQAEHERAGREHGEDPEGQS